MIIGLIDAVNQGGGEISADLERMTGLSSTRVRAELDPVINAAIALGARKDEDEEAILVNLSEMFLTLGARLYQANNPGNQDSSPEVGA